MRKQFVPLLLVLPFLAGCPDLSQVQQLAKTADGGRSNLAAIAADLRDSCDRQNTFYILPPAQSGVAPPAAPPSACSNGDELAKLGSNLQKEQAILITYFDTLGALAGAGKSSFDAVAPKLSTSFSTAGMNSTQQEMAKASGVLVSAITKLATGAYRKKKIVEILKDTNQAVKTVTNGLANQVAPEPEPAAGGAYDSYMGILANECTGLKSYYEPVITRYGTSTVEGVMLNNQYQVALQELKKREDAARAYRKYMLALGLAHDKLTVSAGSFEKADVMNIAKELAEPISDMRDAIDTLQKDAR